MLLFVYPTSLCFPLFMNLFIKFARMTFVHEPRVVFSMFYYIMQVRTSVHA
jgi:hypothetical protein